MFEDNRTLGHKKPCKACPFKTKSMPGYLGGYKLASYYYPPAGGMPTTCHEFDHGAANPASRFCAGSLAVIDSDPAIDVLPPYAEAAKSVDGAGKTFATLEEFRDHHAGMNAKTAWR